MKEKSTITSTLQARIVETASLPGIGGGYLPLVRLAGLHVGWHALGAEILLRRAHFEHIGKITEQAIRRDSGRGNRGSV